MLKRIMVCFVSIMIVMMPTQVQAEDLNGRVASLSLGEEAPYAGVLFNKNRLGWFSAVAIGESASCLLLFLKLPS